MTEQEEKERAEEFAERHPWAASMAFEGPWTEADEVFVECLTGEYDQRLQREAHEREAKEVMGALEIKAENGLGEAVFGPREQTFGEKYPNLAEHVFITWPWGEAEDVWLEYLTGEPQREHDGARDSAL